MVLRGSIRGNGSQLASYLIAKRENQTVQIFDIRGTSQSDNLKKSLIEMSLTAELSGRTKKGLYHVIINPKPGEDQSMTKEQWFRAAEIIEQERGFSGQKRVMVMHEKKGRLHMHAVWERYDHETGLMICNRHSNYELKRCRGIMEREFSHRRTDEESKERPALRLLLADLWGKYPTGDTFVDSVQRAGYTVARQSGRRPFVIVNSQGRSFELVKEIPEARTRQIRERLKGINLPDKNEIIDALTEHRNGQRNTREQLAEELQRKTRNAQKEKVRSR